VLKDLSGYPLVGHEKVKTFLSHLLESQKIPQALIFYGEKGLGQLSFAEAFARALIGSKRTSHPDIRLYALEEDQTSHTIASIRQLKEEVYLPPFEAQRKVLIIQDAHKMLPASANALLKTLEEPSSYCTIILLAHHLSDLLPTVVSRCSRVYFTPLSSEEIKEFLKKSSSLSEEEATLITECSCGFIERALLLAGKEEQVWLGQLFELVLCFPQYPAHQVQERLVFLEEHTERNKSCLKEIVYEYVLKLIRDIMVIKHGVENPPLLFFNKQSYLQVAAHRIRLSSEEMQKLWQESYESLAYHVKLKVGLERLLIRLYA
jgi:DNA polymerase III subunit delta'